MAIKAGAFFLKGLARYDHYWINVRLPSIGVRQKLKGDGYGGMAQLGVRIGGGGFFAEPSVSVDYTRSSIDTITVAGSRLGFGDTDGLRGRAGLRVGSTMRSGGTTTSVYLKGEAIHEFKGEDRLNFANGSFDLGFVNRRLDTYGRGTVGVTIASGTNVRGFLEAFGDVGQRYRGGGGRAGLAISF